MTTTTVTRFRFGTVGRTHYFATREAAESDARRWSDSGPIVQETFTDTPMGGVHACRQCGDAAMVHGEWLPITAGYVACPNPSCGAMEPAVLRTIVR